MAAFFWDFYETAVPYPPTCIDKKDAGKNPALRCGIFAYKVKNKEIKNRVRDEKEIKGYYVAIDYATETLLLTDEKYSNTASQIGAELAREGVVNKINGVKVIVQDLGTTEEGNPVEYILSGVDWAQAIDEWKVAPTINDLKDGSHIGASALQGRMVYEDTITNEEAVIVKTKAGA